MTITRVYGPGNQIDQYLRLCNPEDEDESPPSHYREPVDPDFTRWLWLLAQTAEPSLEGDLARDVWQDPNWPQNVRTVGELAAYLERHSTRPLVEDVLESLDQAYTRWCTRQWQSGQGEEVTP